MIYSFSCPHPCNRVIQVDAHDDEEAIWKIIKAGAMLCRSREGKTSCDKTRPFITPLPYWELREVVRLIMQRLNLPNQIDEACPLLA